MSETQSTPKTTVAVFGSENLTAILPLELADQQPQEPTLEDPISSTLWSEVRTGPRLWVHAVTQINALSSSTPHKWSPQ